MRTIRNFLLTQMPETVEVDEEDDVGKSKEPLAKVFSTWATTESIKACLSNENLDENRRQYKHQAAMETARDLTQLIWGFDEDDCASVPSKDGNITSYILAKPESSTSSRLPTVLAP